MMQEKIFSTPLGDIHYWINTRDSARPFLVFLPGLTADHRLFDKQVEFFQETCNVLVWDAPGHGASRPFRLEFSLMDKAVWLHSILEAEGFFHPVLVGQSMGGYVSQCFLEIYPGEAAGFVSIDSAPLKREYVTSWEIWLLKRMEPVYRYYPWNALKKAGATGCATTPYGQDLMQKMLADYDHAEYSRLAGHGFKILAEAMEADLPYVIDCPCLLICGEKDRAGSAKNYNLRWTKKEGLRLVMIPGAGHNSNTDAPEQVNNLISDFIAHL